MKIWIDDVRTAPEDYIWCMCVNESKAYIKLAERMGEDWKVIRPITVEIK